MARSSRNEAKCVINKPNNTDLTYQQFWQNDCKEDCGCEARRLFDKRETVTQYRNNTSFILSIKKKKMSEISSILECLSLISRQISSHQLKDFKRPDIKVQCIIDPAIFIRTDTGKKKILELSRRLEIKMGMNSIVGNWINGQNELFLHTKSEDYECFCFTVISFMKEGGVFRPQLDSMMTWALYFPFFFNYFFIFIPSLWLFLF